MSTKNAIEQLFNKILSPDWATLLMVDVQNDFCHENGELAKRGFEMKYIQEAVKKLANFLNEARNVNMPVIFIKAQHSPLTNSQAWLTRGPREDGEICAVGSWGQELYLVTPTKDEPVITKHRHSAFYGTSLEVILRARNRKSVLVTGVATNVCVETTLRDAFARDYHVVLVEDCSGARSREEQKATIRNVQRYFGHVLTSEDIVKHWHDKQ